jgi:hypothetical protein
MGGVSFKSIIILQLRWSLSRGMVCLGMFLLHRNLLQLNTQVQFHVRGGLRENLPALYNEEERVFAPCQKIGQLLFYQST